MSDHDLDDVSTTDLIKFVQSIIPKDLSLSVTRPPDITYVSNVPRPAELSAPAQAAITAEIVNRAVDNVVDSDNSNSV